MLAHLTYRIPRDAFVPQKLGMPGGGEATELLSFPGTSILAENRYIFSLRLPKTKLMQTKVLSSLLGREVKGHGVYYPLCIKKKKKNPNRKVRVQSSNWQRRCTPRKGKQYIW